MSRAAEPGLPVHYYKLSGGGNDFIALVEPSREPAVESIRALCRRGLSLGADGLFVLRRTETGVRMDYFNADGRAAELCLNGARCAVRLGQHMGWGGDEITLETGAGALHGRVVDATETSVEVPAPEAPRSLVVEVAGRSLQGWSLRVGVPHFVLTWPESLASAPVDELGATLRSHSDFGVDGTNVNFVRFTGAKSFEIRSYERGVEAETLACGTGVVAATTVGVHTGLISLPAEALTLGGFTLRVDAAPRPNAWILAGDARILAEGRLLAGSELLPNPPKWG